MSKTSILVIIILIFFVFSQTYQNYKQKQYQEELKIEQKELFEELKKIHGPAVSSEFKTQSPCSANITTEYVDIVDLGSVRAVEQNIVTDDVPGTVPGIEKEISWYSELDSCHNRTPEGCLTASGKIAKIGMVATWAYSIGTKLEIDGKIYVVEDRTKKELGHRIDIWTGYGKEAHKLALQNGIRYKKVKVLN